MVAPCSSGRLGAFQDDRDTCKQSAKLGDDVVVLVALFDDLADCAQGESVGVIETPAPTCARLGPPSFGLILSRQ